MTRKQKAKSRSCKSISAPIDGGEYGTKGWVVGASYAPMKNTNIDMAYFHGKSLGSDRSAKTFYTRVQMFW